MGTTNLYGCFDCSVVGKDKCILEEGKCPVEEAANLIEKKWTILILRELFNGKRRFNELLKSINGISPRILSKRLNEMEEYGIIDRNAYAEVPIRVEYSLTEKGEDLEDLILGMAKWWMKWQEQIFEK